MWRKHRNWFCSRNILCMLFPKERGLDQRHIEHVALYVGSNSRNDANKWSDQSGKDTLDCHLITHYRTVMAIYPINLKPLLLNGFTLIPAWICNHIHCNVWDEITYPFLNFNDATMLVKGTLGEKHLERYLRNTRIMLNCNLSLAKFGERFIEHSLVFWIANQAFCASRVLL